MKSTKIWLAFLVLILIGAGAIVFWQQQAPKAESGVAVVSVDGKETMRLNLGEDGVYPIETEAGQNTITVKDGAVSVSDADCPDQICVKTGAISNSTKPIVCLPHKLVIEVEAAESEVDVTAQ